MTNATHPITERAIKLVEKGYTPLLLNGKAPIASGWQNMSVTKTDVENWHTDGRNLGLRTGDNGLIVLDFDGLSGYEAFCLGFSELVDTHTVKTGSGNGMHVYLIVQNGIPKSSGVLNMPGGGHVEIKAKGRQVVIPPSVHPDTGLPYQVHVAAPIKLITTFTPIQEWIEAFNPKPEYEPRQEAVPTAVGEHSNYAKQALSNMAAELARQTEGGRNNALNRTAWKLAHFVRRGDLTESEVRNALEGAMFANGSISANGDKKSFEATFASGFNDGYADTSFEPEIYRRPSTGSGFHPSRSQTNWNEQKSTDRAMPGNWKDYAPPQKAVDENGVTTIRRTRIVKRTSLLSDLSDRIEADEYQGGLPPIPFPLQCMHRFGGQALMTKPGKVIAFVGASGSGKTSALETLADAYVMQDIPVWLWSPEWTPDELAERAVQRLEGVSQDALYLHEFDLWRTNRYQVEPMHSLRLSDETRQKSAQAMRKLRSWPQDVYFVENDLLNVDEMTELIAEAKSICDPFPRVLICDYAQLLEANQVEEGDDSMNTMIHRFKRLCVHFGLVGVIATQTTKDDARRNRSKEGTFKGTTVLNCAKNSRGTTGKVRVVSDPARLRIIDQAYPDQSFDSDDYYLGTQSGRYITDHAFNLFITLNPEYAEV